MRNPDFIDLSLSVATISLVSPTLSGFTCPAKYKPEQIPEINFRTA
jgi:hypothetical protein